MDNVQQVASAYTIPIVDVKAAEILKGNVFRVGTGYKSVIENEYLLI